MLTSVVGDSSVYTDLVPTSSHRAASNAMLISGICEETRMKPSSFNNTTRYMWCGKLMALIHQDRLG
jgi:hypothetical protein